MNWLILLCGIAANASASALLKIAVTPPRKFPSPDNIGAAITNWPLWCGLSCFGIAFLFYAAALSRLPLNVAYPTFIAGTVGTVTAFSWLLFRETFDWTTIAGIALILLGVLLLTSRAA
jgi:multidrug transporter EmrE-like cation transporter